jgi:hypothetical protein
VLAELAVRASLEIRAMDNNMNNKKLKSYAILLSYEVSDEEKQIATKLIYFFDHLVKIIKICSDHLNLIYEPFKEDQNVSPEQVFQARAALRRYRDKVIDNFNSFKRQAFRCFALLKHFSADTQVMKLEKSFTMSISDIEKQVNRFVELFENLKSKDFSQGVVKGIENIKKELAELEQIIEDRIIAHVKDNILARTWVDNVSEELQEKIENKIPLSIELVNERNKKLEGNN